MPASQDFRDGAATGAAVVAKRARIIDSWGVPITGSLLDKIAEGVAYEYGGRVYIGPDPRGSENGDTP